MTAQIVSSESPDESKAGRQTRHAIRLLLAARRMSMAALGRRSGIGEQNLRDRMSGKVRLSIEETESIARVFGIDLLELIELGRGNDPKGLLLSTQLRLVVTNSTARATSPRTPLLAVVK